MTTNEYKENYSHGNASTSVLPMPPEAIRGNMKSVFISYSTKNPFDAALVCGALENAGMRCWVAPRDLLAGTNFADNIEIALGNAKMMVLILSHHSAKSPWVEGEINTAFSARIPILIFRIDDVELEGSLKLMLGLAPAIQKSGISRNDRVKIAENARKLLNGEPTDLQPLKLTPKSNPENYDEEFEQPKRVERPQIPPQKIDVPAEDDDSAFWKIVFYIFGTIFLCAIVVFLTVLFLPQLRSAGTQIGRMFDGGKEQVETRVPAKNGAVGGNKKTVPAKIENEADDEEPEIEETLGDDFDEDDDEDVPEEVEESVPAENLESENDESVPAETPIRTDDFDATCLVDVPAGTLSDGRFVDGFKIGKTEITQAQWFKIMKANPARNRGDDLPVEMVSWNEAIEFCQKLTARERRAGRISKAEKFDLPTREQWKLAYEKGRRASDDALTLREYLETYAWFLGNSGGITQIVAKKRANALGIFDMSGNVWELCQTNEENRARIAGADSTKDIDSAFWFGFATLPRDYHAGDVGLRVALVPATAEDDVLADDVPVNDLEKFDDGSVLDDDYSASVADDDDFFDDENGGTNEYSDVVHVKYDLGEDVAMKFSQIFEDKKWRVTAGKAEVSQKQWEILMKKNPSFAKDENRPVTNVSWHDAMEFCKRLTEFLREKHNLPKTMKVTLPTSKQWEFLCRAGTKITRNGFYDDEASLDECTWYRKNSAGCAQIGQGKKANKFALYDMLGNVAEWCLDTPKQIDSNKRVVRGGSFNSSEQQCKISYAKTFVYAGNRSKFVGFRVIIVEDVPAGAGAGRK